MVKKTMEQFSKKSSVALSEGIQKAMNLSNNGERETYFTFDSENGDLTSNIIVGDETSVIAINEQSKIGGSFHTHPPSGTCIPSARDVYDDFINNDRDTLLVGCPAENTIVEIGEFHIPENFKAFADLLISESTIDKYQTAINVAEKLKNSLVQLYPHSKEKITTEFEKIKHDLLSENEYIAIYQRIDNDYENFLASIKPHTNIWKKKKNNSFR